MKALLYWFHLHVEKTKGVLILCYMTCFFSLETLAAFLVLSILKFHSHWPWCRCVFIHYPGVLMGPSNLETPIFQCRGYSCFLWLPPSLFLMSLCKFCLDIEPPEWSSNFLHITVFHLSFLPSERVPFILSSNCSVDPSPHSHPHFCYRELSSYSRALNQCSLCSAFCSCFGVTISSLISLCILMVFTMFSFSV